MRVILVWILTNMAFRIWVRLGGAEAWLDASYDNMAYWIGTASLYFMLTAFYFAMRWAWEDR